MERADHRGMHGFAPQGYGDIRVLDEYLSVFADAPRCPNPECGAGMLGWGLVHGEANCLACGWPARLLHRPLLPSLGEYRFQAGLYYHPSEVSRA